VIDSFLTVEAPAQARVTRHRSRFLSRVMPVDAPENIDPLVAAICRRYHDATHHCYAFRVLEGREVRDEANDAGEPHGSAGPPILERIEGAALLNVLAVVTRYFGGVKLGIGGLRRAYGDAAQAALDAASIVRRERRTRLEVAFPAEAGGHVMRLVHRFDGRIEQASYGKQGLLTLTIAPSRLSQFALDLREATGDRAKWKETH